MKKTILPLLFLSLFIATGTRAQSGPEGSWIAETSNNYGTMSWCWTLTKDGYAIDMNHDGSVEVSGKWQAEGNHISFEDTGGPMGCIDAGKGTYTFEINGNTLKLKLLEDDCPGRKSIVPSVTWTKEK